MQILPSLLLLLCQLASIVSLSAIEPPAFDQAWGIYEDPFDLVLTAANPDEPIVYTTDGRLPGPGIGTDGGAQVSLEITGTSVIRARCHDGAGNWSPTRTHSYSSTMSWIRVRAPGVYPPIRRNTAGALQR